MPMRFVCALSGEWGLHLIDVHLFMGNLIDIVRDQTAAYLRQKR